MTPLAGFVIAVIAGWIARDARRAAGIVVVPYLAVVAAQTWAIYDGRGTSPPNTVWPFKQAISYYVVQAIILALALGVAALLGAVRARRAASHDAAARAGRRTAIQAICAAPQAGPAPQRGGGTGTEAEPSGRATRSVLGWTDWVTAAAPEPVPQRPTGRLGMRWVREQDAGRTTRRPRRPAAVLLLRWPSAARAGFVAVLAMLAAACSSSAGSPAPAAASRSSSQPSAPLSVTSTLDGRSALPHRIRWQAFPGVPATDVSEVDFLIDGKLRWVENNPPYFYGSNYGSNLNYQGNYLVTSFLKPGIHRFTVTIVAVGGKTASDMVTATVPVAPAPPAALAGTWRTFQRQGAAGSGSPPTGYWRLVISKVGWQIYDTAGTGDLLDVAYLQPGLLEIRTGMFTEPPAHNPELDGNGWCNDDPGQPVRLRWSVTATGLSMRFAGGHGCPGFTGFMTSAWTRVR